MPNPDGSAVNVTNAFASGAYQSYWKQLLKDDANEGASSQAILSVNIDSLTVSSTSGVFPFPSNVPTPAPTGVFPPISRALAAEVAGCVTAAFMGALLFCFLYYFFFKRSKLVVRHPGALARDLIHPPNRSTEVKRPSIALTRPSIAPSPPPSEVEKKWQTYASNYRPSNVTGTNPLVGKTNIASELDAQLEEL